MITLDVSAFRDFCLQLQIPSRDAGLMPFHWNGAQEYWVNQVSQGLKEGIHDFVTLKGGRQIGGSTIADAIAIWWPQANGGTQGMLVSDDDDNRDYRRDVILSMVESLPKSYRRPFRMSNRILAAWDNGSRLAFRAAGKRTGSNLGRSRGVSFLHADEVGSWPDQGAIGALRASLSEVNPLRLYLWNSTARGIGTPFHEMWRTAERATTTRAIFVAWWRHEGYVKTPDDRAVWERYSEKEPSADEALWIEEVERRYGHAITKGQLCWYRWKLTEGFDGDETMMAQEFSSLPEEAFQAFGDKFIASRIVLRMRIETETNPEPVGYQYEFRDTIDETAREGVREVDPNLVDTSRAGLLRVWQEPVGDGVYVVAGHPSRSSSATAAEYVAQVYRVWPDRMVQCAEYIAPSTGIMYQFAWVCLHLAGAYRTFMPPYFILDVAQTGRAVLEQIQLLERYGFGASAHAKWQIQDFLGCVRHYYYIRPDHPYGRPRAQEWHSQANTRPWILHGLRDTLERGQMTLRSPDLIDNLSALRQGEMGNPDLIAGGAGVSDALSMCAALAVEAWLKWAIPELDSIIAPNQLRPDEPATVQSRMLKSYLGDVLNRGR